MKEERESHMKLWTKPLGPLQTNTFLITNRDNQGIIIDPGMEPEPLIEQLHGLEIVAILLTHAHFDHIGGLEEVRSLTEAPVYLHDEEEDWLTNPEKNGSSHWSMVTAPISCQPRSYRLSDGQHLQLAGYNIKVLHTPGHSPGSVSFYFMEHNTLIAGDTLFDGSIGRTDLPGGSYEVLMESIQQKICSLPPDTRIFPGHGPSTTISREVSSNPFLL